MPLSGQFPANPKRLLGIDEEPVVMAGGVKAMKVGKVYPGTAAEKAGLQAGDVIRSVNGYLTEQRGNLAWVIANAMPNNELKLNVQTAKDGQTHADHGHASLSRPWMRAGPGSHASHRDDSRCDRGLRSGPRPIHDEEHHGQDDQAGNGE